MCIISYIPAGISLPEEKIKTMFTNNPDGAGFAWREGISAPSRYAKGFTDVEALIKAFSNIPLDCERALHFRIATSGRISPACCHPFPLSRKAASLKSLQGEADALVLHNGIINFCTPIEGMESDVSDTMIFVKDYLSKLKNQLKFKHIQSLIEEATNSKFLIFNKGEKALMLGKWIEDGGIYYSNTSYKQYVYNSCNLYQEQAEYIEIDTSTFIGDKEDIYEIIKKAIHDKGGYIDNILYVEDNYIGLDVVGLPEECGSLAGLVVYRYNE